MDIVIWIAGGAIVGAIASRVIGTDRHQSLFVNMALGVAGALATGLLIIPFLGAPSMNFGRFSAGAAVVSIVGALAAVIIGNAARRRWAKSPKTGGAVTRGRSN